MGSKNAPPSEELWGGNDAKGWLAYVPDACIPYIQLVRLYNPAPVLIVYSPQLFGLLYAAISLSTPFPVFLRSAAVLLGESFFFCNAGHIWNDLVDAPLDALIERTRHRPIPRKAVTPVAACVFMVTQVACALSFLSLFPHGFQTAIWALPGLIGGAYYPYAKLHTRVPQLVLGLSNAWGVIVGPLILDFKIVEGFWPVRNLNIGLSALFLACTIWLVICDTVYAHLDLQVDLKLGVGSTAVLFQGRTKHYLWAALALMSASYTTVGIAGGLGLRFFLLAVGGPSMLLASMLVNVDLNDSMSIGWWFSNGFMYTIGAVGAGLMLEYFAVLGVL